MIIVMPNPLGDQRHTMKYPELETKKRIFYYFNGESEAILKGKVTPLQNAKTIVHFNPSAGNLFTRYFFQKLRFGSTTY